MNTMTWLDEDWRDYWALAHECSICGEPVSGDRMRACRRHKINAMHEYCMILRLEEAGIPWTWKDKLPVPQQ